MLKVGDNVKLDGKVVKIIIDGSGGSYEIEVNGAVIPLYKTVIIPDKEVINVSH